MLPSRCLRSSLITLSAHAVTSTSNTLSKILPLKIFYLRSYRVKHVISCTDVLIRSTELSEAQNANGGEALGQIHTSLQINKQETQ